MLTIIAITSIKPGYEQQFEDAIAKLFELIITDPGCRGATWGPTEKPGEYALIERYIDHDALEAHRASAHMKDIAPALGALFSGGPLIARFNECRPLDPVKGVAND
jgi:quinol monooxygenase YgiN